MREPVGTIVTLNRGTVCSLLVEWLWSLDRSRYHLVMPVGGEIARGRNVGVETMRGDRLLFVDSDCVPEMDAADRLAAWDLPIVGAVVLERSGAFSVCTTKTFEPTTRYTLREVNGSEPIPVLATGTGCLMIRRAVLDAVESPWFRCGQLLVEYLAEDTEFCLRAAESGFPTFVDPTVRVGHVVRGILWPADADGTVWARWEGSAAREPLGAAS